jgi:hypothetical protein
MNDKAPKIERNLLQVRLSDNEKRNIKMMAAGQGLTLREATLAAFTAWRVTHPVNSLMKINLHERVAHPAFFFWQMWGFWPRSCRILVPGAPRALLLGANLGDVHTPSHHAFSIYQAHSPSTSLSHSTVTCVLAIPTQIHLNSLLER